MTIDDIKDACRSNPFRPFAIRLGDGRAVPIYDGESLMAPPGANTVIIRQPDGGLETVEIDGITGLEFAAKLKERGSETVTIEQIKRLYDAQPFQPFVIHLASGRQVSVPHREFMWAAPSGRTIFVELPDQSVDIIDLLLVTDIVRMPATNGAGKKKRR
jgi:hypothetical protein